MRKTIITTAVAAALLGTGIVSTSSLVPQAGHAMAAEGHKHGQGEKHKLGRQPIAGYTVSVILIGEAEPGEHVDFDIKLIDATSDPKALRVWIGTQDGSGSTKAAGTKGKTTYTGEVDVPKPLPEGAKLWVELETDAGVQSGSFEMDKHDHKH
ncbi:MAG TPA: hypothetical protein VGN72_05725 [Tepidisphaeraceae bacterium]|jgi:hypothetical protein|nr:hypothetical protein [Tepidisphaeraceae bacterium]